MKFWYCNAYTRNLFQNLTARHLFLEDRCCADATPITAAWPSHHFLSVAILFDPPQPPYEPEQL